MIISYGGRDLGERDAWQTEGGLATEPPLRTLAVPYRKLSNPDGVAREIREGQTEELKPHQRGVLHSLAGGIEIGPKFTSNWLKSQVRQVGASVRLEHNHYVMRVRST